jgi:hypothetical protein
MGEKRNEFRVLGIKNPEGKDGVAWTGLICLRIGISGGVF